MSASVTADDLVGAWRLSGWEIESADGTHLPFGDHPSGVLTYTADGWMQAAISAPDRASLSVDNPRQAAADELAATFLGYFSYAGTYDVGDGAVVHHVLVSLNPAMVGTDQTRMIDLVGDRLVLSAGETTPSGTRREHRLTWRRADADRP